MKTTRAYVINIRKIIGVAICVIIVLSAGISLAFSVKKEEVLDKLISFSLDREVLKSNIPVFSDYDLKYQKITMIKVLSFLLNENIEDPFKILYDKVSFIKSVRGVLKERYSFVNESNNYYIPKVIEKILKEEEDVIYNPAIEKTVKSIKENGNYLEKMGITFDNKTTYNPEMAKLYNEKLNLNIQKGIPRVLIVHTHGSESYNPTDRNEDIKKNVVSVGEEMEKVFKENKIEVIHSKKMHDIPKFNNSYKNSLATINDMLSKNKDITVVLDVHRDAMVTEAGENYKVVTNSNGEKISQVMFVVGTDQGGLKHENWKENLKFAMKCQKRINQLVPNLARPINLRKERFNQHTTNASLIIEVGTNGNTLKESLLSANITARAIADVLNEYK